MSGAAEKTARCLACRGEFTDAEIAGATGCPKCGSKGVPADPRKDATIAINPHELRILTIWASNWAEQKCEEQQRRSLKGIIGALSKQLPGVALTMGQEIRSIAAETGSTVQLADAAGQVIDEAKGTKPS